MLKAGNCPICDAKFKNNLALYEHMETDHSNDLNGLGADQYLFNLKYNITGRTCLVCNKSTAWNTKAGRYDRLCGSKKCSDKYRENFKKNMMKVHGSYNLLNDPDQQKKMLENRKISGVYTWSNGVDKFKYTGSYELDFLKFLDLFLGYPPSDIIAPSSLIIRYEYNNTEHFYIPDFELVTLNIVIEVKSTENKHYRLRDIEQEKAKDEAITKFLKEEDKGRQYFKVLDKKYKEFFELILILRDSELNDDEKTELLLNKETKMKREDFDIFNSRDFTEEEQEIFEKSIILEDSTRFRYFNQSDIDKLNKEMQEGIRYGYNVETDTHIFTLKEGIRCTKEFGSKVKVFQNQNGWSIYEKGNDISELVENIEEKDLNESSSLASFASIFFLPISTRPDGYLKLNPELKQYWHTGIIYKGKVYECFNNNQYAITDLSKRKKELEEQEAVYITKEIDLNKLKSEIKSGTSCGTYVARCLGIDNSKGYEKTMYPLDVYNKII